MEIILERNLDFHQFKNVFILNFICVFVFLMLMKIEPDLIMNFLKLIFGIAVVVCVCLMILKKGIVIENKVIHISYYLFGLKIFKQKVETENMKIITLFKFIKSTNYNYAKRHPSNVTRWEPNLNYQSNSFQIFLLDENHTEKKKVLSLVKEQNSNKAIEFITKNTDLKIEIYNPNFE